MRCSLALGVGSLLTAAGVLHAGGQQQPPVFKSGARIVPVHVTVTDSEKRLVPGLVREDFEILDNDVVQPITVFDNEVQPITVVVMLDTSASMTPSLDRLRAGAEQFIIRLLPEDQGRVGAFNDKIEFSSEFTSDRDDLIAALKELDFGNPTRLYDAIEASLDELRPIGGRRVVLVFTDGEDTASRVGLGDMIQLARQDETMVYAIGLESEYFNGARVVRSRPDRGLKRLAEETGGGYFELKKTDELGPTFTRVAQELHSQYVLGFTPAALDGRVHKLTVRLKKPGLTARARKTYLASPERGTTAGK